MAIKPDSDSELRVEAKLGMIQSMNTRVGDSIINHLMYADDLVILSPYSAGLQQVLRVWSLYGVQF